MQSHPAEVSFCTACAPELQLMLGINVALIVFVNIQNLGLFYVVVFSSLVQSKVNIPDLFIQFRQLTKHLTIQINFYSCPACKFSLVNIPISRSRAADILPISEFQQTVGEEI